MSEGSDNQFLNNLIEKSERSKQFARLTLLLGNVGITGEENGRIAEYLFEKLGVKGVQEASDDELMQLGKNPTTH